MEKMFSSLPERDESLKNWKSRKRFDAVIPNEVPAAAGVLPFTIYKGNIYFLLGREAHRPGFRSGGLYADFGGGLIGRNKSSIECAAQELQEETFKSLLDVPLQEVVEYIKDNLWLVVKSGFGKKAPYHLYCVLFPFFDVSTIFKSRLDAAHAHNASLNPEKANDLKQLVPEAFQYNGKVRKAFLEKSEIKWFNLKSLNKLPMREEFWRTLISFQVLERIKSYNIPLDVDAA